MNYSSVEWLCRISKWIYLKSVRCVPFLPVVLILLTLNVWISIVRAWCAWKSTFSPKRQRVSVTILCFTFFFLNVKELLIGLGLKLWWKGPPQVDFAAPTLPPIRYGYVAMNDIYARPNLEITVRFEEIAPRVEKDEVTCPCAQYLITDGNNQLVVQ